MIATVENKRIILSKITEPSKKIQLGQFLTPARTAQFMAGLFKPTPYGQCKLIDPGAGIGSLSSAFLERCLSGDLTFKEVEIEAYELDSVLHRELHYTLSSYLGQVPLSFEIIEGDFIAESVAKIQSKNEKKFTHAIINPPYKKINSNSFHRRLLSQVGIKTVNLYSAFVALTLAQLKQGGQLVAIIPRSFCNGPYYRPFREYILENSAIRHIHLFNARNRAFRDDDVLQENVIILLERGACTKKVKISTSTDDSFSDLVTNTFDFDRIVDHSDQEHFFHIPLSIERNALECSTSIQYSLEEIGVQVSTGPVVDFRVKEHLVEIPTIESVPLLYPNHFASQNIINWPKVGSKKPNAIRKNIQTEKWLYPIGFYCVVRRFSSKEEKRRVVASVVSPSYFPKADSLGFENHLNVFHAGKLGLPEALAHGLAVFLNTSAVDEYFRQFNGHTQVNATDLKRLKYPDRRTLIRMGKWAMRKKEITQLMIDKQMEIINS